MKPSRPPYHGWTVWTPPRHRGIHIRDFMDQVEAQEKMGMTTWQAASFVAQYKLLPTKIDKDNNLTVYYEGRAPKWYDWFIACGTLGQSKRIECSHFIVHPTDDGLGIPLAIRYM